MLKKAKAYSAKLCVGCVDTPGILLILSWRLVLCSSRPVVTIWGTFKH